MRQIRERQRVVGSIVSNLIHPATLIISPCAQAATAPHRRSRAIGTPHRRSSCDTNHLRQRLSSVPSLTRGSRHQFYLERQSKRGPVWCASKLLRRPRVQLGIRTLTQSTEWRGQLPPRTREVSVVHRALAWLRHRRDGDVREQIFHQPLQRDRRQDRQVLYRLLQSFTTRIARAEA